MDISLKFNLNSKLFLKNPEESELGRKIIERSILLIHKLGFEEFTFKKLAKEIGTTEAGVYRYFENKHKLLIYLFDWYWSWQEYRITLGTKRLLKPEEKIKRAIRYLSYDLHEDVPTSHINKGLLYEIVTAEGAKAYLTKNVTEYNNVKLFKPYKDLCSVLSGFIKECNPKYSYARSLATTVVEMAHSQKYYSKHLPSLSDFPKGEEEKLPVFLEQLVFSTIKHSK